MSSYNALRIPVSTSTSCRRVIPKYACNLNMLECSHITPKIGVHAMNKQMSDTEHGKFSLCFILSFHLNPQLERADAILKEFGVKTIKRDPYKIEMPPTSNGGYG